MANSILSAILPQQPFRVFADWNGAEYLKTMKVVKVEIDAESSNAEKPISNIQTKDGKVYTELAQADLESSKIIRPVRMRVQAIVPDETTATTLITTWLSLTDTLTIMSRGIIADNMIVTEVEFEQDPEVLNVQKVMIELERSIAPQFNNYNPSNAADKPSIGSKLQSLVPSLGTVVGLYNKATAFISKVT